MFSSENAPEGPAEPRRMLLAKVIEGRGTARTTLAAEAERAVEERRRCYRGGRRVTLGIAAGGRDFVERQRLHKVLVCRENVAAGSERRTGPVT